ncbi:hypothetical protein [uncultured Mediterranean phage uvMED]|nr:hypothetical protein [uncultured Mediterranean phage uvMED]
MNKRYRRPKVQEGQIKFQKGKIDGESDMCIFYGDNVPSCDRALIMNIFCSKRLQMGSKLLSRYEFDPSLIDELEKRGYDIDTLKFSIEKKAKQ